jgi:hypothetical protein
MALVACGCDDPLNNSGVPGCTTLEGVAIKFIAVPRLAADGTKNRILLTDTLNQAYFDALFNQADATKRWYPLPNMKNVEDTRADVIKETFNDSSSVIIQEGARSVVAAIVARSTVFLGKVEQWSCQDFDIYTIDKQKNIIGKVSADGLALEAIQVDRSTWYPHLIKTTDTGQQKIMLNFEWSSTEKDSDIRQISFGDLGAADLSTSNGLLDVNAAVSAEGVTTATITQTLDFGSLINPIEVEGWVIGDYTLAELTPTPASITITSVTETPANSGIYVFVFPTESTADVLQLTASKTAYDFPTTLITIP